METINPGQLAAFNAIIHKLGLKEQKANIVSGATNGRATSSKDLYSHEARDLIMQLNDMVEAKDVNAEAIQRMRNKILAHAHKIGWVKTNKEGRIVADVAHVDEWCIKYSYLKKKMNYYKFAELPRLVTQFQKVYESFLKSI